VFHHFVPGGLDAGFVCSLKGEARAAVREYENAVFTPALRGDVAVKVRVQQGFAFRLR
jgi:hypothetical protein